MPQDFNYKYLSGNYFIANVAEASEKVINRYLSGIQNICVQNEIRVDQVEARLNVIEGKTCLQFGSNDVFVMKKLQLAMEGDCPKPGQFVVQKTFKGQQKSRRKDFIVAAKKILDASNIPFQFGEKVVGRKKAGRYDKQCDLIFFFDRKYHKFLFEKMMADGTMDHLADRVRDKKEIIFQEDKTSESTSFVKERVSQQSLPYEFEHNLGSVSDDYLKRFVAASRNIFYEVNGDEAGEARFTPIKEGGQTIIRFGFEKQKESMAFISAMFGDRPVLGHYKFAPNLEEAGKKVRSVWVKTAVALLKRNNIPFDYKRTKERCVFSFDQPSVLSNFLRAQEGKDFADELQRRWARQASPQRSSELPASSVKTACAL